MKIFDLPLSLNTVGSDPIEHLYNALNLAFPEYGLTRTNSTILKIQPAVTGPYPTLTYLHIQRGNDPEDTYEFFYSRYDINQYLVNPVFTTEQLETVATLTTSEALIAFMAQALQLNFTADDFWISINDYPLAGGTEPPNWYMESLYNSVYWCGSLVLWLHE